MQHLETCLLIAEANSVFLSSYEAFNCLYPLTVQNEIRLLSRFFYFIHGWFVNWVFG